jgi:hypothetical protein
LSLLADKRPASVGIVEEPEIFFSFLSVFGQIVPIVELSASVPFSLQMYRIYRVLFFRQSKPNKTSEHYSAEGGFIAKKIGKRT